MSIDSVTGSIGAPSTVVEAPKSIDDVIKSLGGTSAVAEALGIDAPVVSNWRSRGRIPSRRWDALLALARDVGANAITLATLADLHADRSAEPVGSGA